MQKSSSIKTYRARHRMCSVANTRNFHIVRKLVTVIENVVATTYFNGHLPCLIASAHKLNVWDQNGKKKIGMCLSPKKYCTTRAFFVVASESWLLVMASDKMAKRSMSHI